MSPLKCWLSKQASLSRAIMNKYDKLCLSSELGASPNKEPIWFQRETLGEAVSERMIRGKKAGLVVNVLWRLSKSHVHVQSDCSWILRDSQRNIMKAFYLNAKSRRGWRREKSLYIQDVETIIFLQKIIMCRCEMNLNAAERASGLLLEYSAMIHICSADSDAFIALLNSCNCLNSDVID